MEVHHLNCGAMQPYGGALWDGKTRGPGPANLTCHCLLLETSVGLVLVDTGTVGRDALATERRLSPLFRVADRVRLIPGEAAFHQIARLGHDPAGVRHIVMTHLDFDHVAGLPDFPGAKVHLAAEEVRAARVPTTPKARARYKPVAAANQSAWQTYETFPAEFFGIPATYLEGVPGLMLVALPGHTKGHCGVAIDLGRGDWLLHAADAIFNAQELRERPSTPTAARLYQWFMETSQVQRRRSLFELRRIARDHGDHVHIICTHDPAQFEASRTERTTTRQWSPGTGG